MDEYSFISENGNVRQIRDLIAKEKDEQQDEAISQLDSSTIKKSWNQAWTGSTPITHVDGLNTVILTVPDIIGASAVYLEINNTYGLRLPKVIPIINCNGAGYSYNVYGNFATTPAYSVALYFRIDFTTGRIYADFNVSGWSFSDCRLVGVYKK